GPPPTAESAAASAAAAPAAAGVPVTESDNGGSVQVGAGGQLVVELPGNPATGYVWQVANNDESTLLPRAYEFNPTSDAAGGGVEKFTFHVMEPGAVNLVLANSRPWETDTPPAETFTLAVEAVAAPAPDNATITVGAADNGGAVTLLPGAVLLVSLDGAADGM